MNTRLHYQALIHAQTIRSLKAEMKKRPHLKNLTATDGTVDPPEVLFGVRRRGYYKAKHLCRVWTLQTLKWLRIRGEYFVVWKNGADDEYDGRYYLAHAFTIKYLSLHAPGMICTHAFTIKRSSMHKPKNMNQMKCGLDNLEYHSLRGANDGLDNLGNTTPSCVGGPPL